jgi:hypothetical protein
MSEEPVADRRDHAERARLGAVVDTLPEPVLGDSVDILGAPAVRLLQD